VPILAAKQLPSNSSVKDVGAYQGPCGIALRRAFSLACSLLSIGPIEEAFRSSFEDRAPSKPELQSYYRRMTLIVVSDCQEPDCVAFHMPASSLSHGIGLGNICLTEEASLATVVSSL
jgi:hypothetical protein